MDGFCQIILFVRTYQRVNSLILYYRSRMNCVIERRRAEELVDNAPKLTTFGFNFNSEPKKRVTGERMAIFCESGNAIK